MCLNGNLKRRQEEIEYFKDTAKIFSRLNDDKAQCLYKSLLNTIIYLNYTLEKFKKQKAKALYYLLSYKPTPKSLLSRIKVKTKYIIDLFLPEEIHYTSKNLYISFIKVFKKLLLRKTSFLVYLIITIAYQAYQFLQECFPCALNALYQGH